MVALEAGSGMLDRSLSLESDGASSDCVTDRTSEDEDGGYLTNLRPWNRMNPRLTVEEGTSEDEDRGWIWHLWSQLKELLRRKLKLLFPLCGP